MILAIIGSREFDDYDLLKQSVEELIRNGHEIEEIVSGGAMGADSLGARYANENNIPLTVFRAEWNKYGKSAGPKRNKLIVDHCDMVLAFWDGESRGTKHSLDLAESLDKPNTIIFYANSNI